MSVRVCLCSLFALFSIGNICKEQYNNRCYVFLTFQVINFMTYVIRKKNWFHLALVFSCQSFFKIFVTIIILCVTTVSCSLYSANACSVRANFWYCRLLFRIRLFYLKNVSKIILLTHVKLPISLQKLYDRQTYTG